MKTTYKFALLFFAMIASVSCNNANSADAEKSADTSKPATAETQSTTPPQAGFASFSCKMDGELIEGTIPGTMAIYAPAKKEVNIRATTPKGVFSILIDNVESTGTFTIKGTSSNGAGIMMTDKMYEVKKSGTPFTVNIETIEELAAASTTQAKAIRGTFQGKLVDDKGNSIEITEGKFSSQ